MQKNPTTNTTPKNQPNPTHHKTTEQKIKAKDWGANNGSQFSLLTQFVIHNQRLSEALFYCRKVITSTMPFLTSQEHLVACAVLEIGPLPSPQPWKLRISDQTTPTSINWWMYDACFPAIKKPGSVQPTSFTFLTTATLHPRSIGTWCHLFFGSMFCKYSQEEGRIYWQEEISLWVRSPDGEKDAILLLQQAAQEK